MLPKRKLHLMIFSSNSTPAGFHHCLPWELSLGRRELRSRIKFEDDLPNIAFNKASLRTHAPTTPSFLCRVQAFGMIEVRITTGRRHQIRVQTAHVGHQSVCDGTYSASVTAPADHHLCWRNCLLHRFHLVSCVFCEVCPHPPHLIIVIVIGTRAQQVHDWAVHQLIALLSCLTADSPLASEELHADRSSLAGGDCQSAVCMFAMVPTSLCGVVPVVLDHWR